MTHEIITQLGPRDTLDIVELNDRFVAALRERLQREQHWRAVADRVTIHHMPVEQLSAEQPYDAIVSGLPLNNFPVGPGPLAASPLRAARRPEGHAQFL